AGRTPESRCGGGGDGADVAGTRSLSAAGARLERAVGAAARRPSRTGEGYPPLRVLLVSGRRLRGSQGHRRNRRAPTVSPGRRGPALRLELRGAAQSPPPPPHGDGVRGAGGAGPGLSAGRAR